MKTIFEYILESIQSAELRKTMTFEECKFKDISDILDTDEYNHCKDLNYENPDDMGLSDKNSLFYKIMSNENLLGIFGIKYLKDDKTHDDDLANTVKILLCSAKLGDAYGYAEPDDLINVSAYVTCLQLSSQAKKNLDINQIAVIKVFYEKLIDLAKSNGAKVICGHGKDKRVTQGYIKAGGFESYKDKYLPERIKKDFADAPHLYENFVIKKI